MCGIVGAVADRNVPPILLEGLKRLEYRGYDSAGLAVLANGKDKIECRRQVGKVKQLIDDLAANPVRGTIGIAHTRWATHGVPSVNNAHPHISNDRICLVHNGIIENFERLRKELKEAGYEFSSETDSEVIVHLVDLYYRDGTSLLDAVRAALKRLEGAYALGVIARDDPERIIAARMGSPLVVGRGMGENFIASDVMALRTVTASGISIWNLDDETVIRSSVKVELGHDDVDKGNYRHHMQKEIHEQPRVIRDTLEGRIGRTRVLEQAFGVKAGEIFDRVEAVTIVACGTSFYAASIARYWVEDLVGIPCSVEIASEFRYRRVAVTPGNLFVTISQSGKRRIRSQLSE